MGYVYRYTDFEDNIIKYVGIVWSENRTLLQRVKEHQLFDEWCNGKQWKIEYLEIDNKTDCEGLEGHFISLYGTNEWFNKGKANWGVSKIYSMIDWEWEELNYISEDVEIKKRKSRRINDSFLSSLYEKSIYIFNNGSFYCFFQTFKKEPIYVFMALDPELEEYAVENDIRYMNREQLDVIIRLIKEDNKPYGYGTMPREPEQTMIENNLTVQQCFTYKERERLLSKISEDEVRKNNWDLEHLKRYLINSVYEMCVVDLEHIQEQKLKCA